MINDKPSLGTLAHYGVKGMKWGIRRRRNENYTDKQRKQDRAIYGRGAERRVNKRMNQGYGVKGARAYEADRRQRKEKRKQTARQVLRPVKNAAIRTGKIAVGTAAGLAYADLVLNNGENIKKGANYINNAAKYVFIKGGQAYWNWKRS